MKKLLLLLLPAALFFTACGDDDNGEAELNEIIATITSSCTYLDVQAGSKLTYKVVNSDGSTQTITSKVVDQEEIDGVSLIVFETDDEQTESTSYLSCEGEKFISSAPAQSNGTGTTTGPIILTYDLSAEIDEELLVSEIQSTTNAGGQSFITTNRYYGTVLEKGLSMTVEGKTYSDVINYQLRTLTESSSLPGQEFEIVKTVYYFAPEVANVKTEIYDVFSDEVISTVTLADFEY